MKMIPVVRVEKKGGIISEIELECGCTLSLLKNHPNEGYAIMKMDYGKCREPK